MMSVIYGNPITLGGGGKPQYVWNKYEVNEDESTVLLLHGEELADSSKNTKTITNAGAVVSTGRSKFGGKSLYFNGSSYMQIALPVSGDCTVDFWFYQQSHITSYPTPMNFASGASRGLYVHTRSSKTCYGASTPTATENEIEVASAISLNSWHHIAVVRSGTTTKFYLDGVEQGTLTGTLTSNDVLYLGYLGELPSLTWFNGWIDELRVSTVARWTENFDPPTSPYSLYEVGDYIETVKSTAIDAYPYNGVQDGYYYKVVGEEISITENGLYDVRSYVTANVAVQDKPTLLWTNAAPGSSFAEQTITLPTGYDAYMIEYKARDKEAAFGVAYCAFSNEPFANFCGISFAKSNNTTVSVGRKIGSCADGSISFEIGCYHVYSLVNGTFNGSKGEDCAIPTRIWGLKFTL